jgi:serine/threonine protein kinase
VGASLALDPGATFADDYRVIERLSEGGQGALYVVEQLSTQRRRALKLMRPELVTRPELRKRFEIEAHVGARIKSDHVVDVIASGVEAGTGTPWIVMELLEGEDLGAAVARRGALPAEDVHEIFGQLCHALGAAHEAAIVHRDLKPENIFLARPRRRAPAFMVKVIDFGVARMVAASRTANATQSMLGTPLWMAPEQVTPGVPIGPQADVWSLGLLAFFALTGRSYWTTATEEQAGVWRILNEVCVLPLARASERAEGLPAGFDAWFARCVVRDPAQRFADATQAYEALETVLAPIAEEAAPVAPIAPIAEVPAPAAATPAKARWPVIAAVGAILAIGAAAAALLLR